MRLDFCVACGSRDGLEHHHLKPRAEGGSDDPENLLTLCYRHHGEVHGTIRKDIRKLSMLGRDKIPPEVREDRRRKRLDRGALLRAGNDQRLRVAILEPLRAAFQDWPPPLRAAARWLADQNIPCPSAGEWGAESVRRVFKRLGCSIKREKHPYLQWAAANRWVAEQLVKDCRTYLSVTSELEERGIPTHDGTPWTATAARRFIRANGLCCSGPGGDPSQLQKPNPTVDLPDLGPDMAREYRIDWNNFCRWRGEGGRPATKEEIVGYLPARIAPAKLARARRIVSGISYVNRALGGEKLSMWPEVRKIVRAKREAELVPHD